MKKNMLLGMGLGLAALASPQAKALGLDFSSVAHSFMQFDGVAGSFTFTAPTQVQFQITGSDGVGDSVGDDGWFTGVYNVAALTPGSGMVATTGSMTIRDHGGQNFVATFANFININAAGTDIHLNGPGTVDLTGVSYAGGESDLQMLARYLDQSVAWSASSLSYFSDRSHAPATLLDVFQGGSHAFRTGYSGQIVAATPVPDGGLTLLLLGGALTMLGVVQRRMT